jgi:hypothetical protein
VPKLIQGVPYVLEPRLQCVAVSSGFTDLRWGDFPCIVTEERCSNVAVGLMKDNSKYIHVSQLFFISTK